MKILQHDPGIVERCSYCNSQYELQEGDKITVKVDVLCGKLRPGWYLAKWECPSCGKEASKWLHDLPGRWANNLLDLFREELLADEEDARKKNMLYNDSSLFSQAVQ